MGKREKLLLKMARQNGAILPADKMQSLLPVYRNGDRRNRPIAWMNRVDFVRYCGEGLLESSRDGYQVANSAVRRMETAGAGTGNMFRAQQREMKGRQIYNPQGDKVNVAMNTNVDTVARLSRLLNERGTPFLSHDEIEAANRFALDYGRSGMGVVATQQFDRPKVDSTAHNSAELISILAIDSKERVMQALAALGPGLDQAVIAICGNNNGVGAVEATMGWAKGSGKTVLKLALGRLSAFYGCQPGRAAQN